MAYLSKIQEGSAEDGNTGLKQLAIYLTQYHAVRLSSAVNIVDHPWSIIERFVEVSIQFAEYVAGVSNGNAGCFMWAFLGSCVFMEFNYVSDDITRSQTNEWN